MEPTDDSPKIMIAVIAMLVGLSALVYLVLRSGHLQGEPLMRAAGDAQTHGPTSTQKAPEHAVTVHLKLSAPAFGTPAERAAIHRLSRTLEKAIADAGAGDFDGDEFGGGKCLLFMYGPDADRLFTSVIPVLHASPLTRGGWVVKRYGSADDPKVRRERVSL